MEFTLHANAIPSFLHQFSQPLITPHSHSHSHSHGAPPPISLSTSTAPPVLGKQCRARRRIRYDEEEEEEEEEEYGYNEEIQLLEIYTESMKDEVLFVQAMVDDQNVEILIFKGFSSCLSYKTSPDPTRSVVPKKAVIKSIDRIRGPFDPSNIQYIQKGLTFDSFKNRLKSQF
ncbi:hypothetical protein ACJIZ3_017043 [Penstemon smallii]|uniref:DUF7734 domain-containing protein n=1 Tax=Penstemon smallii TaxID=265156 RepID=A0ABD3SV26_9LAMI